MDFRVTDLVTYLHVMTRNILWRIALLILPLLPVTALMVAVGPQDLGNSLGPATCGFGRLKQFLFGVSYGACMIALPMALIAWLAKCAPRRIMLYPIWVFLMLMLLDLGLNAVIEMIPEPSGIGFGCFF